MLSLFRTLRTASPRLQYSQYPLVSRTRYASTYGGSRSDVLAELEMEGARILRIVRKRIQERASLISQISDDMSSSQDIAKSRQVKELEPLQMAWDDWTQTSQLLRETTPLLSDSDPTMRSLALEEYNALVSNLSHQIKTVFPSLLVPSSTTAHFNALVELKSGVGGSEASLFLAEMLRVYTRFASSMKWKTTILASNDIEGHGGIRDAVVEIRGQGCYDALRWESGVHRVQRVPATETSGRTHTSTIAIVVLPLSEETSQDKDDDLFRMEDIKLEVMRARGAGGQHVNKTESAVRLTHTPTGITVSMQDERSQHQNKRRAFQVLRARLLDVKLAKDMAERRAIRRGLVQGADRSEKIRTYNFAQDRVTDHRIGLTIMNLTSVMEGDGMGSFISAMQRNYDESVMEEMLAESN